VYCITEERVKITNNSKYTLYSVSAYLCNLGIKIKINSIIM